MVSSVIPRRSEESWHRPPLSNTRLTPFLSSRGSEATRACPERSPALPGGVEWGSWPLPSLFIRVHRRTPSIRGSHSSAAFPPPNGDRPTAISTYKPMINLQQSDSQKT